MQSYLNLITSEHFNKTNFISFLASFLSKVQDITSLLEVFDTYFTLDTATGKQLDVLGNIVGVKREVNFQPSNGISPILDDATFLMVIRAKIAKNQWDGTIEQINDLWNSIFEYQKLILFDNQDMSLNVFALGFSDGIQKDLVNNGYIIPKPLGVLINYSFPTELIFSYDLDNDVFSGYDTGHWYL